MTAAQRLNMWYQLSRPLQTNRPKIQEKKITGNIANNFSPNMYKLGESHNLFSHVLHQGFRIQKFFHYMTVETEK